MNKSAKNTAAQQQQALPSALNRADELALNEAMPANRMPLENQQAAI